MLLDTHSHLDLATPDVPGLLAEIRRRRVFSIAVSQDPRSYAFALHLASREPLVLAAYGVHPAHAPAWVERLDELVAGLDGVALLGEIGLDHQFVKERSEYPAQAIVFESLLAEAVRRDLVVNLRTKAAEEAVAAALRRHGVRRAIVHSYAGSVRAFRELVDFGAYFSVGVSVLHDETTRAIAAEIPLDRLLTETDQPGDWRRSAREGGQPSLVIDVQRELARVREMPVRDLQNQVGSNFECMIAGDARLEEPYRRAGASF